MSTTTPQPEALFDLAASMDRLRVHTEDARDLALEAVARYQTLLKVLPRGPLDLPVDELSEAIADITSELRPFFCHAYADEASHEPMELDRIVLEITKQLSQIEKALGPDESPKHGHVT